LDDKVDRVTRVLSSFEGGITNLQSLRIAGGDVTQLIVEERTSQSTA